MFGFSCDWLHPITVRRETSSFSLSSNQPESSNSIFIDSDSIEFAVKYFLNGSDSRLLVETQSNIVCVENGTILWRKSINNERDKLLAFIPDDSSKVFFYANRCIEILDEKTGKLEANYHVTVENWIKPLVRKNEIICVVKEGTARKISCFDFNLKEIWKYQLDDQCEALQFFDFEGETVIVLVDKVILLDKDGMQKSMDAFNCIKFVFKASKSELFLIAGNRCYIFNIFNNERKTIHIAEVIKGSPIALPYNGAWNGFVSRLSEENTGYGIYQYPLGIFDAHGNCTRINLEEPIQYITVDANQTIVVLSGLSKETFSRYKQFTDSLKYELRFLDITGKELEKIEFKNPVTGPLLITPDGELAYFADGELRFYRPHFQLEANLAK